MCVCASTDALNDPHCGLDPTHGRRWVLVLPNPQNDPTCRRERSVVGAVTFGVASQLGLPVLGIGLRTSEVGGTAMPEAPVHEDDDARGSEDDVWSYPTTSCLESAVLAEPKPSGVQLGT